jgi:sulfoxide reductase heme-binding subunit YedZ
MSERKSATRPNGRLLIEEDVYQPAWSASLQGNRRRRIEKAATKLLFLLCLVPFLYQMIDLAVGGFGSVPVRVLILSTGDWTMRFLLASLAVRPLSSIFKYERYVPFRRTLGLVSLFYVCLHFMIYIGLDYLFQIKIVVQEALSTPHILVGFGSFIVLVVLGVTSLRPIIARLGARRWRLLHRFAYLAAVGGLVHYLLKSKVVGIELIAYASVLAVLLGYRIYEAVSALVHTN